MKWRISTKWTVLWSLWMTRLVRQPSINLRVSSGWVRGSVAHDGSHVNYLGIPYATVERRFQAPGPEPSWDGILEATDELTHCTQKWIGIEDKVTGQEDCLRINVYTPLDAWQNRGLPVMVFIHGGGFMTGAGVRLLHGPNYLVPKNVILVTFNYRVNVLGQLCLRTKEAPGNAGMKDQVAALKWVQRNIRTFGGDPDNVTIFGESAGATSVSYHILSPLSKGLFHKAITQSGSSLCYWGFQYNPVEVASRLAQTLGHKTDDPYEIYRFLMSKTDRELVATEIPRSNGNIIISDFTFTPCVEAPIDGEEAFLTELPYNLLTEGHYNKVPMIKGTNDEEGHLFASLENDAILANIDIEKAMPKDLVFPSNGGKKLAADRIRKLYMGEDSISRETLLKFSRFEGEPAFDVPSAEETELLLKSSDNSIYGYFFNYNGYRNFPKLISGRPLSSAGGATHSDELYYLFSQWLLPTLFEHHMINKMTTLWTNFAKYGNPTPIGDKLGFIWEPMNRDHTQVMVLNDKKPVYQPLWYTHTMLYWKELYQKYRRMGD